MWLFFYVNATIVCTCIPVIGYVIVIPKMHNFSLSLLRHMESLGAHSSQLTRTGTMDTEHVSRCEVAKVTSCYTRQGNSNVLCIYNCLSVFLPYLEAECDNNCTALSANINCSTSEHFSRCLAACSDYDPLDETSSCYDVCVSCT